MWYLISGTVLLCPIITSYLPILGIWLWPDGKTIIYTMSCMPTVLSALVFSQVLEFQMQAVVVLWVQF